MPQRAKDNWGGRPSKKKAAAADSSLDTFVSGEEEMVRLNVQIPRTLRARVKSRCALENTDIKEVVIELLRQRFPE